MQHYKQEAAKTAVFRCPQNSFRLSHRWLAYPRIHKSSKIKMPTFVLNTNVPTSKIPGTFLVSLTDLLAKILHKPKSYICVHIHPDQVMSFNGTGEPCGYAVLSSIGSVGAGLNNQLAKQLFPLIQQELGIAGNRMYVTFVDLPATDVAHNGNTFA